MSSTGNPSVCKKKILLFLAEYRKPQTRQQYETLATLTRKRCEELLKSISVKGVVQCRTKEYDSLAKKLKEMEKEPGFSDWASKGGDISEHHEMGDLAGVRIGLYLPSDVVTITKELRKHFNITHLFGTVTGGRDTTQDRNLDVEKHANGPWQSQGLDGTDEYWQHYGYKSWQMVVEWKETLPNGRQSSRVEIQVGTVVTQAWAEIQHNIIYKRPEDIASTPTMKRMIDAINGLAITTEIILKELERSQEVAEKEAKERDRRHFKDGYEFQAWFDATYLSQMPLEERKLWIKHENANQLLIWFCNTRGDKKDHFGRPIPSPCPAEFKKLIKEKNLLQPKPHPNQVFSIPHRMLDVLGYNSFEKDREW